MKAPALADSFGTSARLLREHPLACASLGAAIVLSLCATCTGVGLVVGPWFVCELYGVQLTTATGVLRTRDRSWFGAAGIVLAIVLVFSLAGWLAALGIGPDVATADASEAPLPWPEAMRRVGMITGSIVLAIGFIGPFLYAPLVLIDRGGRIGGAIAESAWLVSEGGVARHLLRAFLVFLLQLSPALIAAMFVARTFERAATPLGLLGALPVLPFSIALGQGMVTATYLAQRGALASPRAVRARGTPPRPLVATIAFILVAPIAALTMLSLSALRESSPVRGPAESGEVLVDRAIDGDATLAIPGTTLALLVNGTSVAIESGDGAQTLPSAWHLDVDRVRVVRARDVYAIEVTARGDLWHARVDRAGMRVDDSIRRRLEEHVPTWALLCILAAFLACGILIVPALAPLGRLRATVRDPDARAAYRESMRYCAALVPFALAALIGGVVSIVP